MTGRPLYGERADTYDDLFADPAEPWVEAVRAAAPPPASLLDAGCGTGRYSAALAAAGYDVALVDGAEAMLAVAAARMPAAHAVVADLRALALGRSFGVVTCRGVLNDIVAGDDRDAAIRSVFAHVAPGGTFVGDVRDRDATRARYAGGHVTRRGRFEACGTMDGGLVRVVERHDGGEPFAFVMRPWTPAEVIDRFTRAGFGPPEIGMSPGRPDRLLVVARR